MPLLMRLRSVITEATAITAALPTDASRKVLNEQTKETPGTEAPSAPSQAERVRPNCP